MVHPHWVWTPTIHTTFLLYVIWECFCTLSSDRLYKHIDRFTVWCFKITYSELLMHVAYCSKIQNLLYCDFTFIFSRLCSLCILHLETTSAYLPYDSVPLFLLHKFFWCFWNFIPCFYLVPLFESRQWIFCLCSSARMGNPSTFWELLLSLWWFWIRSCRLLWTKSGVASPLMR